MTPQANDIQAINNLYIFLIIAGFAIAFIGIILSRVMWLKTHREITKDPRVLMRPKKWMWAIGIATLIAGALYLSGWLVLLKGTESF